MVHVELAFNYRCAGCRSHPSSQPLHQPCSHHSSCACMSYSSFRIVPSIVDLSALYLDFGELDDVDQAYKRYVVAVEFASGRDCSLRIGCPI